MINVLAKSFKSIRRCLMAKLTVELEAGLEEELLDSMIRKMFCSWEQHISLPDIHWQKFYRDPWCKTQHNSSKPPH